LVSSTPLDQLAVRAGKWPAPPATPPPARGHGAALHERLTVNADDVCDLEQPAACGRLGRAPDHARRLPTCFFGAVFGTLFARTRVLPFNADRLSSGLFTAATSAVLTRV
jgi:hypothetical protein